MHRPERDDASETARYWLARAIVDPRRLGPTLALACAGYLGPAHAERWTLLPAIDARATWSDNVSFEEHGARQSDTIFELIPSLQLRGEGKRFRIAGTVSLDALTYANGTRNSRALPSGDLTANLEAIERLFFIEAGISARQASDDVFAPRPDGGSDFNTVTTTQYRLAPTLEGRIGSEVTYRVRSNNSWTQVSGSDTDAEGSYLGEHSVRIARRPAPFGWSVEAARSDTRFEAADQPSAVVDSGRISLLYAFTSTVNFGLRGGYETTNIVIDNQNQVIYGAELNWRPSERTDFSAFWEERFFGSSWNVRFNHRMPRLAWTLSFARDIASFPQTFLTLPPTNNVAALLDAAFTTRFPDPTERSRVVQDLIARQGLPPSLATQTPLFAQRISLVTTGNATIAYLGVRNSVALSAFHSRTEDLSDSIFSSTGIGGFTNVTQDGTSLTYTFQASPTLSANLTSGYTRSRGVGINEGLHSKQVSFRLQLTRQIAPKTSAFIGARTQKFDSNVDVESARENAAFVGLGHRF
jgi:uncharacterized protein (PEP-CTERM system associated)